MNLQAERPDAVRPSLNSMSAAEQEDRLLEDLVPQVRAEREQLADLLRSNARLRRLLSQSHDVVARKFHHHHVGSLVPWRVVIGI